MMLFNLLAEFVFFLTRSRGYKTFFMLNSAEAEIKMPHKCQNRLKFQV